MMKSKHRHFQSLWPYHINEKISLRAKTILIRKIKQPISYISHKVIHNLIFELKRGLADLNEVNYFK